MRISCTVFAVCSFLLTQVPVSIASGVKVQRDATALTEIAAAITALGGDSGLPQLKDSLISGSIDPTKGSAVKPASFVWKTFDGEVRYETTRDPNAYILVSGYGKPAVSVNGVVTPVFYQDIQGSPPFQITAFILSGQLGDLTYSVIDAGQTIIQGKTAEKVQTSSTASDELAASSLQTWYFDVSTGLPLRVEYEIPEGTNDATWTNAAMDFTDYRVAGILTVPFSITYSEEGVPLQTFTVAAANFNVGLDPAEFDLLGGGGK